MDYFNNSDLLCNPMQTPYKLKRPIYKFSNEDCEEPVTVQEFKEFASIDFATDDLQIMHFIKSARIQSERFLQRSLIKRGVVFSALECPDDYYLSWGPVDQGNPEIIGDYLVKGGKDVAVGFESTRELALNPQVQEGVLILALSLYDNRNRILSRERETGRVGRLVA